MIKTFNEFQTFSSSNGTNLLKESLSLTTNLIGEIEYYEFEKRLRDVMWNWSTRLFYGNNYKGNPETDIRVVSPPSDYRTVTAGDLFKDYWEEVDDIAYWANEHFGTDLYEEGANINQLSSAVQAVKNASSDISLKQEVIKWMKAAGISIDSSNNIVTSNKTSWGAAAALGYACSDYFKSNRIDPKLTEVAKKLFDKTGTITSIQNKLSKNIDFEGDDFGLDSWMAYVTSMPGWGTSINIQDINKFGWTVLWTMSAAILDIHAAKIGAGILVGARKLINDGTITDKDVAATAAVRTDSSVNVATPASNAPQNSTVPPAEKPKAAAKPTAKPAAKQKKKPNFV